MHLVYQMAHSEPRLAESSPSEPLHRQINLGLTIKHLAGTVDFYDCLPGIQGQSARSTDRDTHTRPRMFDVVGDDG